jgi:hypothetical protein
MAIGIVIEIPGGTKQQHDAVLEKLALGGKTAPGGIFHVAGPMEGGWRVVDVWESEQAFQAFFQAKLGKALEEVGVPKFQAKIFPVHNTLKAA